MVDVAERTFIPGGPLGQGPPQVRWRTGPAIQKTGVPGKGVAASDPRWVLQLGIDNYRVLAPDRFGETEGAVEYGEACILTVTSGKYAGTIVAAWVDDPEVPEEHMVYLINGRLPVKTEEVVFDFENDDDEDGGGQETVVQGVVTGFKFNEEPFNEPTPAEDEGADDDDEDYEPLEPGAPVTEPPLDPAAEPEVEPACMPDDPEIDKTPTE